MKPADTLQRRSAQPRETSSLFARSRGPTFTSARVLVRAPIDGQSSHPTDASDHTVKSVLSRLSWPYHRMCVAARHGHIRVASTSKRLFSSHCSPQESGSKKNWRKFPDGCHRCLCFSASFTPRQATSEEDMFGINAMDQCNFLKLLHLEFSNSLSEKNSKNLFSRLACFFF